MCRQCLVRLGNPLGVAGRAARKGSLLPEASSSSSPPGGGTSRRRGTQQQPPASQSDQPVESHPFSNPVLRIPSYNIGLDPTFQD